jgi:hypothetical protein
MPDSAECQQFVFSPVGAGVPLDDDGSTIRCANTQDACSVARGQIAYQCDRGSQCLRCTFECGRHFETHAQPYPQRPAYFGVMDMPDDVDAIRMLAARNNAEWCHLVANSHGIHGQFLSSIWASTIRTPPFYPDAVTLNVQATARQIVSAVDATSGCSVKDSFARLDLRPEGFDVLFDAEWIYQESGVVSGPTVTTLNWSEVVTPVQLDEWQMAWSSSDDPNTFLPALLDDEGVVVLAGRSDGIVVAGAVLNRSTSVVGVSNVFAGDKHAESVWPELLAQAGNYFSACVLVGYESGNALAAARAAGFHSAGPLRVWLK